MYKFYLYHPDLKQPVKVDTPVGWDALGKSLARDRNYHGIFTNYTTKLKFVKSGKYLIHNLYEQYGIEAVITLIVMRRDSSSRKYLKDFEGRLNLTTLVISRLYAECNCENSGMLQKFLNRQDIKVDMSKAVAQDGVTGINLVSPISINLPSQSLRRYSAKRTDHDSTYNFGVDIQTYVFPQTLYLMFAWEEMASDEIAGREDYPTQFASTNPVTDKKYYFKAPEKGTYVFNIRPVYVITSSNDFSGNVAWYFVYGKNGAYTTVQIGSTYSFSGAGASSWILDSTPDSTLKLTNYSINLNVDDEVYVYGKLITTSNSGQTFDLTYSPFNYSVLVGSSIPAPKEVAFSVQADTTTADTTGTVIPVFELARQVVDSICDKPNTLLSDYYGRPVNGHLTYGGGSLRALTNGYQLRGISNTLKPVTCSFKDLYAALKAIDNIGVGYEIDSNGNEYIRIEPMSYFYQPVELFKINNVLDIQKSIDTDSYFNLLEIGYAKYDFNRLSHLDEFNTKRQYTMPITQISKTLSYLSPFIASGYTIELVRRDRATNISTDNQADNDTFIIQLRGAEGSFTVDLNQDFANVANVISPSTIYNLKLAPGRMARNHGNEVRAITEKMKDTAFMKFSYSEGNSSLVTKLTGEASSVSENIDVPIKNLNRPQVLGEVYSFKGKLTRQQLLTLFSNPYGYISFSESDRNYSHMYVLEASRNPVDNTVNFKGIAANI